MRIEGGEDEHDAGGVGEGCGHEAKLATVADFQFTAQRIGGDIEIACGDVDDGIAACKSFDFTGGVWEDFLNPEDIAGEIMPKSGAEIEMGVRREFGDVETLRKQAERRGLHNDRVRLIKIATDFRGA